jgi:hypothetical protein
MTDADKNTPSKEHGRIAFQPNYDKYGVAAPDNGTVILRIDSDKHLFERAASIHHRQSKVVLKEYVDGEDLDDEGPFETVESVPTKRDRFESRLRDAIVDLIHDGEVSRDQAEALADDLAGSFTEQDS